MTNPTVDSIRADIAALLSGPPALVAIHMGKDAHAALMRRTVPAVGSTRLDLTDARGVPLYLRPDLPPGNVVAEFSDGSMEDITPLAPRVAE